MSLRNPKPYQNIVSFQIKHESNTNPIKILCSSQIKNESNKNPIKILYLGINKKIKQICVLGS